MALSSSSEVVIVYVLPIHHRLFEDHAAVASHERVVPDDSFAQAGVATRFDILAVDEHHRFPEDRRAVRPVVVQAQEHRGHEVCPVVRLPALLSGDAPFVVFEPSTPAQDVVFRFRLALVIEDVVDRPGTVAAAERHRPARSSFSTSHSLVIKSRRTRSRAIQSSWSAMEPSTACTPRRCLIASISPSASSTRMSSVNATHTPFSRSVMHHGLANSCPCSSGPCGGGFWGSIASTFGSRRRSRYPNSPPPMRRRSMIHDPKRGLRRSRSRALTLASLPPVASASSASVCSCSSVMYTKTRHSCVRSRLSSSGGS